jgi:REP element-mobilizing transposase RayT
MPDHLHLLARPRTLASDVLTLMDRFKGKATSESWPFGHVGRLWQPRSYDHVLRHDEAIHDVAEYIAHNPVRKRYVARWEDWPYTVRWDAGVVV